ncbi:MAG: hypothetical protein JXQ75_08440 [Phycisphaerae bacterium]|nr:hypothetical protein [Phycisphaerae bacterium]
MPLSSNGKPLWRSFGARTVELIHESLPLEAVRDDLEMLVMDAEVL